MFMAELDFQLLRHRRGWRHMGHQISWRLVAPDGCLVEAGAPVELTLGDCVEWLYNRPTRVLWLLVRLPLRSHVGAY